MKRILATTTILALSAGAAAAEVTLSGDARMGIIGGEGVDTAFTSRARVTFTLSGETDGGLSFGASFRADNARQGIEVVPAGSLQGGANSGTAGSVFISGAFGKLTMGDIDGAAEQAVGNVDGVGLTGLGDRNESVYVHDVSEGFNLLLAAGGSPTFDPTAAYEYSTGGFTGIISVQNPGTAFDDEVISLGLKYTAGDYTFALGYETSDVVVGLDHVILGVTANLGAVSLKAIYGQADGGGSSLDQYALSATYTADALSVTAFYNNLDDFAASTSYGIGASYDLGGGASVVGGYADTDGGSSAYDLGLSFSF